MRYRSLTHRYLASDGVYHLNYASLSCTLKQLDSFIKEKEMNFFFDHDASLYQVLFASRTGVSPYILHFSKQNGASRVEFRKVINWYYAHGLSFTLHLCAAFPPGANSRLGLGPSFSFAITQEIIVIFFSLHLLRCFNSVGCSYLNWNIKRIWDYFTRFYFFFLNL